KPPSIRSLSLLAPCAFGLVVVWLPSAAEDVLEMGSEEFGEPVEDQGLWPAFRCLLWGSLDPEPCQDPQDLTAVIMFNNLNVRLNFVTSWCWVAENLISGVLVASMITDIRFTKTIVQER
ncbi:hypothetical protein GW17_00016611, partial [Ensete ventricosum]